MQLTTNFDLNNIFLKFSRDYNANYWVIYLHENWGGEIFNMKETEKKDKCIRNGLNITDQEISEALAIDLEDLKKDKNNGELTTSLGTITSGWWSNNWCE